MDIDKLRKAGKIHKDIKCCVKEYLNPKKSLLSICEFIETKINKNIDSEQLNGGIAFPTGVSIDNIAAHYTPLNRSLNVMEINNDSVCKIDFGVHIDGNIVDSALTICFNEKYNALLKASEEAVDTIIKNIGVDMKMHEIGSIASEIVESYEYDDKPLKVIDNLFGHNILPYKIHGGKFIPSIPNPQYLNKNAIIEDNDVLAIEVFVSNGSGTTYIDKNYKSSHFMVPNKDFLEKVPLFHSKKTKKLFKVIKNNFRTLPFCQRYLANYYNDDIDKPLNEIYKCGLISSHPPLLEKDPKSKVAQFEHTIHVTENSVEQFT